MSETFKGVSFGVVIGFLNFIKDGKLPVMIIVNARL
jgi:hypothetical protein